MTKKSINYWCKKSIMKTILPFLFVAFCLLSSSLFAQSKSFNVGIEVTPNYSFYSGSDFYYHDGAYIDDIYYSGTERESTEKKPSISFGVILSYQLNNRWSFESGLKYVNRGHKKSGGNYDYSYFGYNYINSIEGDSNIEYQENYNYLSVPLNARFALGNNPNKGWYIRFGVSADYYLSSQTNYKFNTDEVDRKKGTFPNDSDIRKTHLNLNYGVGYSFLVNEIYQLSVEPAFDYMFYRLYHKGDDFTYNSAGVKLRLMIF